MSRRSARAISWSCFAGTVLLLLFGVGCWEQWSDTWWPQMKRQKAVQAYESPDFEGRVAAFVPPEGTVPAVGGPPPAIDPMDDAQADALTNPRPMSMESLENGRVQYERFCAPCHGKGGMGDGPVSMTSPQRGPFGGVLMLSGPASLVRIRSDGHIYTTIRYGRRRMPSYRRIPSDDRWDIVNYLRYLNGQKEIAQ